MATKHIYIIFFLLGASISRAQTDTLTVLAQFDAQSLKIRWATARLNLLRNGFNDGYFLSISDRGSNQEIYRQHIRPLTDTELLSLLSTGSDSLVYDLYQSLRRGRNFFTDQQDRDWQTLGFLFGIADNFTLSKALGLGAEIMGLDSSRSYRLTLQPATRTPGLLSSALTVAYQEVVNLPAPSTPEAHCKNLYVSITGHMRGHTPQYASYHLERDTTGHEHYDRINTVPLLVNYTAGEPMLYVRDSLPATTVSYYRWVGKDIWGTWGPPSEPARLDPCHLVYANPHPLLSKETTPGRLELSWNMPEHHHPSLSAFEVYRARERHGPFEKIASLPVSQRVLILDTPWTAAYYQVYAVYAPDRYYGSMVNLGTIWDLKPPAVPERLKAQLDTATMIVTLSWDPVADVDLKGYRVSFAHGAGGHKFLLNNLETPYPTLQDTLGKYDMYTDIYYWVTSRDFNQNESFYSDSVHVMLPDVFPPVPARFTALEPETYGIRIFYDRSPSVDAEAYFLQKRTGTDTAMQDLRIYPQDWNNQLFDTIRDLTSRSYRLKTVDAHGLIGYSEWRQQKVLDPYLLPPVDYVRAEKQDSLLTIYFDYPDGAAPVRFRILGGVSSSALQTISIADANAMVLQRGIIKTNSAGSYTLYKYQVRLIDKEWQFFKVRAMDAQGKVSPYSKLFSY